MVAVGISLIAAASVQPVGDVGAGQRPAPPIAPAGTPTVSIRDVSVVEGSGRTRVSVEVTLSAGAARRASVEVAAVGGTATAGVDFKDQRTKKVAFGRGQTTKSVTFTILGDEDPESDETIDLRLANPVGMSIGDGLGVVTIVDDDTPPTLSVTPVSVVEGDSGTSAAVFAMQLDRESPGPVSVVVETVDGTAAAGEDYVAVTPRTVSFAAGQTTQTVGVDVVGDVVFESDETFSLALSSPAGVLLAQSDVLATIVNDDVCDTSSLQAAIDAADEGDTLTIAGTCTGSFAINKTLNLVGSGDATLDGQGADTVLWIDSSGDVTLRDIDVTGGAVEGILVVGALSLDGDSEVFGNSGDGIRSISNSLTLNDRSSVRDNGASGIVNTNNYGGGRGVVMNDSASVTHNALRGINNFRGAHVVMNDASTVAYNSGGGMSNDTYAGVVMNDSSSIAYNSAAYGGGIVSNRFATVTMNDQSKIIGNSATTDGGGIYYYNDPVPVQMYGESSITGNSAQYGGGIYDGTSSPVIVEMYESSTITGNIATIDGGGVFGSTAASSGSASVAGNSPNDFA